MNHHLFFIYGRAAWRADAEALSKDEKAVDAVSGATLVDTAGYVGVLVDAAK